MAKKEAKEMSVEQKLQALYELQTTLTAIDEKRALRGELPLEVQEAQANLERYNNQLNEVRNNREYDSLSKQIDYERLEVELCNKKIKEATDQVAYRTNDLEIAKTEREERQKDLDEKKSELEDILAETREEETMLKERATDLEVKIEPRLLSSFKRIRKSARNGLGIVYVQRDACGGCFNKIPPQRQLDIRMRKKIIVCEYCGRIMIDPELAGVKIEKPAEEKPKRRARRTLAK